MKERWPTQGHCDQLGAFKSVWPLAQPNEDKREAPREETKVDICSKQKAAAQMERDAQITVVNSGEARRTTRTPAKQISSDQRPGRLSPLHLLRRGLRGPAPFFLPPSQNDSHHDDHCKMNSHFVGVG